MSPGIPSNVVRAMCPGRNGFGKSFHEEVVQIPRKEFCFVRCICIFYLCRWHLSNSYWAWLLAGRGLNLISACAAIMMTFLLRVLVCEFFQDIAMRIGCWWYKFSWHCLFSKSCPNPPKALYELHHVQRQAVACPQSSVFWNCAFASPREHLPKRKNKESLSSEHTPPKLEVGLRRTKWGSTLTVCSCSNLGQGLPPHSDLREEGLHM